MISIRIGPTDSCATREGLAREDRVLALALDDREGAVDDAAIRIETERDGEVELFVVAVEPESVIGVRVTVHDVRER